MSFEPTVTCLVIMLYLFASLGSFLGALSMKRRVRKAANWLTLAGFAVNTLLVISTLVLHSAEELSAGYYMLLLSWCVLFLYLCARFWLKFSFLNLTAAPLALVLVILATRGAGINISLPSKLSGLFVGLHISSLFTSISLLSLAFGAGVLFLYMEQKLKKKEKLGDFLKEQPALTTFDRINHLTTIAGFSLYSLGLFSGYVWSISAQPFGTVKSILSIVIWVFYALLFYQRVALGKKGRKMVYLTIFIFSLWIVTLIIELNYPIHHSTILLP